MFSRPRKQRLATRALWLVPILVLLSAPGPNVFAQEFMPGEVLVVFNPGTQRAVADLVIANSGARVIQYFEHVDVYHLATAPNRTVAETIALLRQDATVKGADPNYWGQAGGHLTTPNDDKFGQQWGLNNTGTNLVGAVGIGGNALGVIDADIDAPQGWVHGTDCSGEVVAVLDTGIDFTHPDFAGNIWVNPREIAGDGLDNDDNGIVDDINGADFVWKVRHDELLPLNGQFDVGECVYLDADGSGGVSVGDTRLTMCLGFLAGSVVAAGNGDLGNILVSFVDGAPNHERHNDADGNTVYSVGDAVYRDADNSSTVSIGDTRLQAVAGFGAPPTVVVAGDADIGTALGRVHARTGIVADVNGHGTQVASVIGARGNNGINIAGVCWTVQLMAIKTNNAAGSYKTVDEIAAIDYVVGLKTRPDNPVNVRIINFSSWRKTGGVCVAEKDAIGAAGAEGILFVTIAGNDGLDIDLAANPSYPCQYVPVPIDNIICVGASDNRDNLGNFAAANQSSNWGTTSVDLNAPGVDILMLRRTNTTPPPASATIFGDGTSFAAPHVAGIAAHFWSRPELPGFAGFGGHTVAQLKDRLLTGFNGPLTVPHPHGVDPRYGGQFAPGPGGPLVGSVWSGINNDGRARLTMGDDFGDAPPPYPTILLAPPPAGNGARHEDIGEEWLGRTADLHPDAAPPSPGAGGPPIASDVSPEFDAFDDPAWPADPDDVGNLVDLDLHDDGIGMPAGPLVFGPPNTALVHVFIETENNAVADAEGGRYLHDLNDNPVHKVQGGFDGVHGPADNKFIWVNGFFDWNGDGDWVDPNEHVFMLRADPSAWGGAAGGYFKVEFNMPPAPAFVSDVRWARFRLDYGENVGMFPPPPVVADLPTPPSSPGGKIRFWDDPGGLPDAFGAEGANRYESIQIALPEALDLTRGVAQFGEVEDYPFEILTCPKDEVISVLTCTEPPITVIGNTTGAGNNSSCRPSEDRNISVNISEPGVYSFSMCGNQNPCGTGTTFDWNAFLYLVQGDSCVCNPADIIASNDDGCGFSCVSEILDVFLLPGEYWLVVEGFSVGDAGDFDLHITSACPPSGANLYTDPAAFEAALLDTDKQAKANWNFKPNKLAPGSIVELDDPLNINTHFLDPDSPWFNPLPPNNDACADRRPIFNGKTPFDNTVAILDGPTCDLNMDTDVWWNYSADFTGSLTVDTCQDAAGTLTDTVLTVYNGCDCAALGCLSDIPPGNELASDDDTAGCGVVNFGSTVTVPVVLGNCYKIQVGGWNGQTGTGIVTISKPPAGADAGGPALGAFAERAGPSGQGGGVAGGINLWPPSVDNVTFQSNVDPNPQPPFPNPRGVDGLAFANNLFDYDNNILVANVLTDSFDILSGPPAGDNHTAMSMEIVAALSGPPPGPVLVTVYDKQEVVVGKLKVDIFQNPPPCSFVVAFPLVRDVPVVFNGDNTGAINDCGFFPGGHAWEAIIMPPDPLATILNLSYCGSANSNNGGPFGNAWLNLAQGCPCTSFTAAGTFAFSCVDGNVEIQWTGLIPGKTYYYPVLLDPPNNAIGPYSLTFTAKNEVPPPPCDPGAPGTPVNNCCIARDPIFNGKTGFDNTGATLDGPNCDLGGNMATDVWWNYTADFTGNLTVDTCQDAAGTLTDTVLTVYNGCTPCPTDCTTELASDDDTVGCGVVNFGSTVTVPVVLGNCYKIQVGGWNGGFGSGIVTLSKPPAGAAAGGDVARKAAMGKAASGEPTSVRPVAMGGTLTDQAGTGAGGIAGGPIKKTFLGIIMKPPLTIGRVNLRDLGGGAEGISKITVYSGSSVISDADISGPGGPGLPDGCVDAFDLGTLLGAWCSAAIDPDPPGDIDPPCEGCISPNFALADISGAANVPDGCVDAFDLAKLLANWCSVAGGNPCGTCGP